MKILLGDDRLIFHPETDHDTKILKKLNDSTIRQIRFDDTWSMTGNLNVIFIDNSSWNGPNSGYGSDEMGGR